MKRTSILYLALGLILMAITLLIFFVPRMNELGEVSNLQWTKLGIVLASQVVLMLSLILLSRSKSMFLILSMSSFTSIWFIINLVVTLLVQTMQSLILWVSIIFLIYVAILLFMSFAGNTVKADEDRDRRLMEESKKKNLYKK